MSSFPTHQSAPSESNHKAVRTPDLEFRSLTLFLGRAWLTGRRSVSETETDWAGTANACGRWARRRDGRAVARKRRRGEGEAEDDGGECDDDA